MKNHREINGSMKLNKENEVLTIPYNLLECGGDILIPGDTVSIRVSYETETKPASNNTDNPNQCCTVTRGKATKTDILFDSIVVKDMLNANSQSIYEVYQGSYEIR